MTLGFSSDQPLGVALPGVPLPIPTSRSQAQRLIEQQTGVRVPTSRKEAQRLIEQQTGVRVPTSRKEAERMARQAVSKQTRQIRRQVERQARKEVGKFAKRVGLPEAERLARETFKSMGIPKDIPWQPPRDLSVGAIKDSAIATGSAVLEREIQRQTGLPIPIPRKLSVKEITGVLPSDAAEAIELGINIGIQYASSAIATLIAGATIGSAIPGLGTVIGIGMALGVQAVREALVEKPVVKPCKANFPVALRVGPTGPVSQILRECPPFPKSSPMELLPWLANTVAPMQAKLKQMDGGRLCHGPLQQCASILMTVSAKAYRMSEKTPQVLGLYQLGTLIPQYERALQQPASRATQDIGLLLPAMRRRQAQLADLVARANTVERMSARNVADLRWRIVTELRNAGTQFVYQPDSRDTRQWLSTLSQYMRRVSAREASLLQERRVRQQQQQKRFEEGKKDPAKMRAHNLQILRFQCSEGNKQACEQARRLAGSAPTPQRRPTTSVARPTPRPQGRQLETQVRNVGNLMLNAWLQKNPKQAKCVTPRVRESVLALFIAAHAKKTISVPAATQRIAAILSRPC